MGGRPVRGVEGSSGLQRTYLSPSLSHDSIGRFGFSSGFSAVGFASSEERDFGANGLEIAEGGLKDCVGGPRALKNFMDEFPDGDEI
jgi:hypothetical protein